LGCRGKQETDPEKIILEAFVLYSLDDDPTPALRIRLGMELLTLGNHHALKM
jgi:hypothetical protein